MRDPERKIVCDILANGFSLVTREEVEKAQNRDVIITATATLAENTRVLEVLHTLALVRLAQGIAGLSFASMVSYLDIERTERDISDVCKASGKSLEELMLLGQFRLAEQQERERK